MEKTKTTGSSAPLKLNYKRTFTIGFAFFGILLLWQIYNMTCPTFLTEILRGMIHPEVGNDAAWIALKISDFAMWQRDTLDVQYIVGIIMAIDNMAALIMLPIFGRISDKTKGPLGKRMPFILIGTLVSAIAVPFIPLAFHYGNFAGLISTMAVVIFFMMMYRSPAVALMPDMTPKPLRAKANGIINVMGYLGGGVGTILLIIPFFKLTNYINAGASASIWQIEIPYLIVSFAMIVSVLVLFLKIKENKIEAEVEPEMRRGEMEAEIEDKLTDKDEDAPMTKANRTMLILILVAEVLWFMSFNSVETYMGNYVIYYLNAQSSYSSWLAIVGGVFSVAGFLTAGLIADKIGRKWTISIGLSLCVVSYFIMCFVGKGSGTEVVVSSGVSTTYNTFPFIFYVIWAINGFGGSLIHTCSFPMVVELCTKKKVGQFTGYYYAASMLAQSVTPILIGLIFLKAQEWVALPIYAASLMFVSLCVFLFVKSVKVPKLKNKKGLENLGGED
ncbi:MAG: MFS transporter [Bacilli bacterium]|jgi:Na+/melibiose symporter-like transporter|nr:MFS transporter [Bacilli bacterium]